MVQRSTLLTACLDGWGSSGTLSVQSISQRQTPYYPVSSGPSTHLVTVNKLVRTSYTDTGPLECTHLKHNLWLLLVIPIEEDTLIFVAHNKWTHTINITLCSQQQYTKYTHLNVLQHYRRKRTQSQSMDFNSWTSHLLPIEKAIYFGIMKNTRAITEAKTVNMHLLVTQQSVTACIIVSPASTCVVFSGHNDRATAHLLLLKSPHPDCMTWLVLGADSLLD